MHAVRKAVISYLTLRESLFEIDESKLIIVEGSNDFAALRALGIENPLVLLEGEPLYKVVEACARTGRAVIILTDLDSEGEKLFASLYHDLTNHGVKIDVTFRTFLRTKTPVRMIEELSSYYFGLEKQCPERFTLS